MKHKDVLIIPVQNVAAAVMAWQELKDNINFAIVGICIMSIMA
jgi:hypothetical protein